MTSPYLPQKLITPQSFTSVVVHGDGQGRKLGFPTANFKDIPNPDQLKTGVYFGYAKFVKSDRFKIKKPALIYFGPRLVFGEQINNFEVYIYDFSQQIYGETVTATLTHFLRPPVKAKSKEELIKMIEKDKEIGKDLIS